MKKMISLACLLAFLTAVGCSSTSSAPPKPATPPKTTPDDKPKPP